MISDFPSKIHHPARAGFLPSARRFAVAAFLAASMLSIVSRVFAAETLKDQNGRVVQCPERVERIATLTIPAASIVVALDQGPRRLIGMHPSSRMDFVEGLIGKLFPEAKNIRVDMTGEGFAPNVEALLSARPELVVQWGDRGEAIVAPIVGVGLPVLSLRYGESELAAGWVELMGRCVPGLDARGKALARDFLAVRDEIAKTAAALPDKKRPKVVYLYRAQGNAFQVAGNRTGMDSDIRLAGGVNVAADVPGFAAVGAEQLLAWAPDVVLLNNFEKGVRPAMIFENALLASLPAVREKRVYLFPLGGFRWDPPSHETPLAWRWLLALFHPEARVPSLREKMLDSYRVFYGRTVSADDLDQVLRMAENGESRHYRERFGR
ncbi:MAG: ABC transporter substrate-binding protein [Candidatus Accumulibacter sp.]|jgi:iron complex transport system substrate-binding protein|nr:ABC transporter substrate-binding protein [Accumulibacter sp.]